MFGALNMEEAIEPKNMVAYRAETAMANFLRESMARVDEARTLLRSIYRSEADLIPNYKRHTLTVRLHHLTDNRSDQSAALLCEELNQTETVLPKTNLRMIFEIGKNKIATLANIGADIGVIAKS